MHAVLRASRVSDPRFIAKRWAGGWTVKWKEGARLFVQDEKPHTAFLEAWDRDNPQSRWYHKMEGQGRVGEKVSRDKLPFKPNDVDSWRIVEQGYKWAPSGELWTRYYSADGEPYYCLDDRSSWTPQPPQPPRVPPPQRGADASPIHEARRATTQNQNHNTRPASARQHRRSWEDLKASYLPERQQLTPMRLEEVKRLKKADYYGIKPVPLNLDETVPIGSIVYFIHDFKVLIDRISKHPGCDLDHRKAEQLKNNHFQRMQIVRWHRKAGTEFECVILIERCADPNRQTNLPPPSFWVPANVVATPLNYHAVSFRDLKCTMCNHVSKDSHEFNAHMTKKHNDKVRKCPACHVLIPFSMIHEHQSVCEAPAVLLRERENPKQLTEGTADAAPKKEAAKTPEKAEKTEKVEKAEKAAEKSTKDTPKEKKSAKKEDKKEKKAEKEEKAKPKKAKK